MEATHGRCPATRRAFIEEIEYFINDCILESEPPLSSLNDAADARSNLEATER